jgi:Cft2 family RNA processing exonuclease
MTFVFLYTGDLSLEDERHLKGAEIPSISPDILIIESTHGVSKNEGRVDREFRFFFFFSKCHPELSSEVAVL